MQITPTAPALPSAPQSTASAAPADEPGAFAKMLSAQKPAAPTPPAKPARARAESGQPKAEAAGQPAADPTEAQQPAAAEPTRPAGDTPHAEPNIESPSIAAEVLAALNLPAAPPAAHATGASPMPPADALADPEGLPALSPARPAGGSGAARARTGAIADIAQAANDDRKATGPTLAAESLPHTAEQTVAARHEPAAVQPIEMPRSLELPPAPAVIAPAQRADAGATTAVTVAMPTPATAPEFREALGVQVSVLARDGVQQAELHLNPADMGPISVQIALVGTQAQVDFGAESLATRQIIESGLPELAAALRDAGFTLAGGGVSQHSRGRGSDGGEPASPWSRRGHDADPAESIVQRVTTRLPQGAVDLYA
jgi:flagellar hook-length control protein FliK